MNNQKTLPVKVITVTAMLTALNVVLSSFGLPVPGGHMYLNDVVICTAAILLAPFPAFVVGGIGAFLGDFFFYPTPMFVSLVTHGLQAVVISLCVHRFFAKKQLAGSVIGVALGAVIMVVGYSLGRAFLYSTPEYAILKLPYQILQAVVGAVLSIVICYGMKLRSTLERAQLLA
ncbi:MAG: ECF transporter S component [Eubacteriales bacterium]|nr:ECF transporter S component [Eubacteriales bacterium]